MRAIILIAALAHLISSDVISQPFRPPDALTPQQAYNRLLAVRSFAFGGVGYAGVTAAGQTDYHTISRSTNALALFSAVLTNGNAQAKMYALCGVRELAPQSFDTSAKALLLTNPKVETVRGCIVRHEFATNVIARISAGEYDSYFRTRKR